MRVQLLLPVRTRPGPWPAASLIENSTADGTSPMPRTAVRCVDTVPGRRQIRRRPADPERGRRHPARLGSARHPVRLGGSGRHGLVAQLVAHRFGRPGAGPRGMAAAHLARVGTEPGVSAGLAPRDVAQLGQRTGLGDRGTPVGNPAIPTRRVVAQLGQRARFGSERTPVRGRPTRLMETPADGRRPRSRKLSGSHPWAFDSPRRRTCR